MKTCIFLTIFMVLYCNHAYAVNYVIDKDNNVIAKINYEPSAAELEARQETLIRSDIDVELQEAEYRGNKIAKKKKTQAEKDKDALESEKQQEMRLIKRRADKIAYEQLKAEGVIFKHIKDENFD